MHDYGLLQHFYRKIWLQYSMTIMGSKVHTQNHEMSNDLGPLYLRSSLKTCLADFYFECYKKVILSAIAAMISLAKRIYQYFPIFRVWRSWGRFQFWGTQGVLVMNISLPHSCFPSSFISIRLRLDTV